MSINRDVLILIVINKVLTQFVEIYHLTGSWWSTSLSSVEKEARESANNVDTTVHGLVASPVQGGH